MIEVESRNFCCSYAVFVSKKNSMLLLSLLENNNTRGSGDQSIQSYPINPRLGK